MRNNCTIQYRDITNSKNYEAELSYNRTHKINLGKKIQI